MRKVAFSSSPNRELTENSKNAPHIRRNSMLVGSLSTVLGSILLPPKRERDIILVHSTSAHQLPSKKSFLFCLLLCFCNVFATLATHRIHTRKTKTFAKKGMAAVVIYLMYLWWTFVGSWRRGIVLSIVQHIGGKEETMIHIGITNESFEKEKFNHCTAFKGGINLLTPLGNP